MDEGQRSVQNVGFQLISEPPQNAEVPRLSRDVICHHQVLTFARQAGAADNLLVGRRPSRKRSLLE